MTIHSPLADLDTSISFLQNLRPGGPWNLTSIVPDGPVASATFTDPAKTRAWLAERISKANLYFAANPASKPTGKGGRVTKQDIDRIEFLPVDIDSDKLDDDQPLDARKADALAGLIDLDEPSFVIDSGGGLQAAWKLKEPLPATAANIEWAEDSNRWLIAQHGGDIGTHNVDRLLRLPGTVNYPDERKKARGRVVEPTKLVHRADETYGREAFQQIKGTPMVEVDTEFGPAEEVVNIDALMEEYRMPERLRTIILEGRLPEDKKGDNSASGWLMDATVNMLRSGVPPEVAMGVLLNTEWEISASVYNPEKNGGRTPEAYALRQVKRAAGLLQAEQAEDAKALADHHEPEPGVKADPKRPHPFTRYSIEDLIDLPEPVWTVENLILERSLAMLYGPPKSFKTFAALDLALCIATGRAYHGHAVVQGRVIYVAAEGHAAETRDRVLAWCKENGVEPSALSGGFALVIHGVKIDQPKTIDEFIKFDPTPCDVLFLDTLNRNMDGHESDTKDMTAFVAGCDKARRVLNTAVVVIHHSGLETGRERGSTVLRGAVDARLRITCKNGVVTMLVEDQRAGPAGAKLHFQTARMLLDMDTGRDSIVMRSTNAPLSSVEVETSMLLCIQERRPQKWTDLVDPNVKGMSRANIYKIRDRLIEDGYLKEAEVPTLTKAGQFLVREIQRDEGDD